MMRLLTAGLAAARLASATVILYNDGVLEGWNNTIKLLNGNISQTDQAFAGKTAINFTQVANFTKVPKDQAVIPASVELQFNDGFKPDQERWYSFAVKFGKTWGFTPGVRYDIVNFVGDFSDKDPKKLCATIVSPFKLYMQGNNLSVEAVSGKPCGVGFKDEGNIAGLHNQDLWTEGVLNATERWYRFVLHGIFRANDTGLFEILLDDKKIFTHENKPTALEDPRQVNFRIGMTPAWDRIIPAEHGSFTTPNVGDINKSIYFDEIRIGDTAEDVSLPAKDTSEDDQKQDSSQ